MLMMEHLISKVKSIFRGTLQNRFWNSKVNWELD